NKSTILIKDRVSDEKKEHHISEITVLKEDGSRYIYGLPIYNNVETEVVFNVSKNITYPSLGLVDYDAKDASTNNKKGCSKFYSSTKKPPFVHSFMLTALLSSDYQDKTGDGVSDDDIGTAINFNYLMADDSYKWRAPYLKDKANFQEGLNSSTNDNQGNYIYGEKELVYIQSIQSKTHTAIFEYGERLDGVEVKGSQGGEGKSSMNKLISITLYTNPELKKRNPTYVMKVHFVYDNSLCKGISNNRNKKFENTVKHDLKNSGKLTLQEVYFTYNGSSKSARNRYRFDYKENNPDFNPNYHLKANNRWGTYKPENANPNNLTNAEYPYVLQDKTKEDVYVSAWSLRQIDLPSGASMNIDYESDSYEYVQDRKAMQMFTIKGFSTEANTPLNSLSDQLYTGNGKQNNEEVNEYMYLEYPGINKGILDKLVRDIIDKDSGYVSFNCMIDIDNKNHYESVRGYGKIVNYGMNTSSQNSFWIKFEETETGCAKEVKTHPISLTAINFGKLYMMSIFTNSDCPPQVNTELTTKEKKALVNETKNDKKNYLFRCFNNWLVENEGCKSVKLDESFVRLFSPTEKLGGGSRVKKITIHDSWDKMTRGSESVYGKEYTYHKGVASYEPLFGGDENPFKQPVTYSVDNKFLGIKMAPSVDYMQEEPIGEIHFPSAQVVYTKVTEKNLAKKDIKRNATGKTVYTHYTSKDFPTICQRTTLNPVVRKGGALLYKYHNLAASQGFVVVKNDMHGKLKQREEFRQGQSAPYSWVSYNYQTKYNKLDNTVKSIDNQGNIIEKLLGIDYDIYTDMRRFTDNVDAPRFSLNYDVPVVIPPLLPIPVISPVPGYKRTETSFSSAVIQKVIHQYGILESVVVSDENSSISTKNILYDAETGNVLLTKTYNEYEDPIINFSYPAHWAYKLMGSAYENLLYSTIIESDGNGKITSNSDHLFNGDELILSKPSIDFTYIDENGNTIIEIEYKAWVLEKDNGKKYLINRKGDIIQATSSDEVVARVIRSGNRNQINTSMAQITSSNLKNNDIQNNLKNVDILNASAVEFNDYWRIPELVNIERNPSCKKDTINPFVEGILGNYRPTKSYLFLSDRQKSATDVNVRKDGYYKDFSPFWG
ncbi:MAG: hypothetical protein P8L91_04930, partial [Candidatus Marinimicrobia bacterium]|nr:hypothetical protein [Candidatus Neomarinimicrobiota bacterium]